MAQQSTERGLKIQIVRQVALKNDEAKKNARLTELLLDSWQNNKDVETVECLAWDYVEEFWTWKKCDSALLGIKTTVREEVNAKGKDVLYHYTANGKYFGSATKLGNEPVSYEGNFHITRENFEFNRFKLSTATTIADLFEPDDKSEDVTVASLA